jgi:superoxide reductase
MSDNGQKLKIYKCPVCDTVVEVLNEWGQPDGPGWGLDIVCCGRSMGRMRERTRDRRRDAHLPVIQRTDGGVKVSIGRPGHVMEEDHYLEWIEVLSNGRCYRQFLRPGDEPAAVFNIAFRPDLVARAFCNLHGLWRSGGDRFTVQREHLQPLSV